MSQPVKKYYTPEEYLALEEQSEEKHEYYQGEIYLMSGGSARHSKIAVNIVSALDDALLEQPCAAYNSDLKVFIEAFDLYTYPDGMVICGPLQFVNNRTDIVTNPTLIVEVLSPSTQHYDQGGKFVMYQGLASLQDYILIGSNRVHITHYQKIENNNWIVRLYNRLEDSLEVSNLGINIPLARIYRKVEFTENSNPEQE